MPSRPGRVLAAIPLLCAALACPAAAQEGSRFRALSIAPLDGSALRALPALLNMPHEWLPGDAAAVLLFDPPAALELRDRLLEELLRIGAAVLELDANTSRGFSAESDEDPLPPTPEGLVPDLAAGLRELKRQAGAGVVVAIGHGQGGEAALRIADPAVAEEVLGRDGNRFVAHVAFGSGAPVFVPGEPPPEEEAWPRRAPMLCASLALAMWLPLPQRDQVELRCRASLVPDAAKALR